MKCTICGVGKDERRLINSPKYGIVCDRCYQREKLNNKVYDKSGYGECGKWERRMNKVLKCIIIAMIVMNLEGCSGELLAKDNIYTYDKLEKDIEISKEERNELKREFASTLESVEYELLEMQSNFRTPGGKVYSTDRYIEFVLRDNNNEIITMKYNGELTDLDFMNSAKGYNYVSIVELEKDTEYKGVVYSKGILNIEVYYK